MGAQLVQRVSSTVVELADREATKALETIDCDDILRDLLYILDAHGPGSRARVMKAPSTRRARDAKRSGGIFYTPSDVAENIAREAVGALGEGLELQPSSIALAAPVCS